MSQHNSWEAESLWLHKLDDVRNLVRQELVARQIGKHLPAVTDDPLILDVGCGQGTQVLRLANKGYRVVGVDISSELLQTARVDLALSDPAVRDRVQLLHGDIHQLDQAVDEAFDVVLCHGVLMYMSSLEESLTELSAVLKPDGMLSVLTRNQARIAMRAGMTGDWTGVIVGFDAQCYDNRVGVKGTRADTQVEVATALRDLGLDLTAWYGVRLFTDHWGDIKPPEDFDQLLAAEEEAGRRDPYRMLASLTHYIAHRGRE